MKLDLRRSLRLTVADGRMILDALDFAKMPAKHLRAKLTVAITRATHTCDKNHGGRCSVCGEDPDALRRLRERQSKDFKASLQASAELTRKLQSRSREVALRTPPKLKLRKD